MSPAVLGETIPLLTVVGGVDIPGKLYEGGFIADWIKIYGPAEGITCASQDRPADKATNVPSTSCGRYFNVAKSLDSS